MSYKTKFGQSILDIMLQNKGSITGLTEFYKDLDSLTDTVIDIKEVSINKVSNPVTRFYDSKRLTVSASKFIPEQVERQPETLNWIQNMVDPTTFQINAIDKYIIAEKTVQSGQATSNQSKKKIEMVHELGLVNGVVGSDGVTIGVLNGGVVADSYGFDFDGIDSYVDTNYNNSLNNQDNNFTEVIVARNILSNLNRTICGAFTTSGDAIRFNLTEKIFASKNSVTTTSNSYAGQGSIVVARKNNSEYEIYLEGQLIDTVASSSSAPPNLNQYVGCQNLNNIPSEFFEGVVSGFMIAEALDFNQEYHNINRTILSAELISGEVMDTYQDAVNWLQFGTKTPDSDAEAWVNNMPARLSLDQGSRLDTFVQAEKSSGNWSEAGAYLFTDLGAVNSLVSSIGTTGSILNNPLFLENGLSVVGTNGVDTNIDVSLISNYSQNDATVIVGERDTNIQFNDDFLWRTQSFYIFRGRLGGSSRVNINSNNSSSTLLPMSFTGYKTVGLKRTNSSTLEIYENGVLLQSLNLSSTPIISTNFVLGTRDALGIISSLCLGKGSTFNQSAHDLNLRNYLGI